MSAFANLDIFLERWKPKNFIFIMSQSNIEIATVETQNHVASGMSALSYAHAAK